MNTMSVVLLIYLVALIILSVMGYFQTKKAKDSNASFMTAEQSNSWINISWTIFGIAVGASAIVGVTGDAYTTGFFIFLYIMLRAVNYMLVGIIGGRQIRHAKSHAASAYYSAIWGRSAGLLYGLLNGFVAAGLTSVTIMGVGALFPVMTNNTISNSTGLIIATIFFLIITLAGGIVSTGFTNWLNAILMIGGTLVLAIACISYGGGISNIYQQAVAVGGEKYMIGNLSGKATIIIWAYVLSILPTSACGGPEVLVTHTARSDRDAILGPVMGGVWQIPMSLFIIACGYMAVSFFPGEESGSLYYVLANTVSPLIGALAVAGVFAANLSSATGLSLGACSVWGWCVNEFRAMSGKEAMDGKSQMVLNRLLLVIVYILGYVIATAASGLITMVVNLSSMMACASLLWYFPKAFRKSTFMAVVISGMAGALAYVLIPAVSGFFQHIIYPQLILGIIAYVVSVAVDKRPVSLEGLYSDEEIASWTPAQRHFFLREKSGNQ